MQLEDLRQIHDGYDHVYLSPHLDDAALSCGGAIARHTNAGARVLVVTLCTAAPPPDGSVQQICRRIITDVGAGAGARPWPHGSARTTWRLSGSTPIPTAPACSTRSTACPRSTPTTMRYSARPRPTTRCCYSTRQLIAALHSRVPRATFYAPLGVGNHVDHQIVYDAAREGGRRGHGILRGFPVYAVGQARLSSACARLASNLSPARSTSTRR